MNAGMTGFGEIEFVRSARARNINVRIRPDGLRVSLPPRATEEEALRFIESVREKIVQRQERLRLRERKNNLQLGEDNPLQTLTFAVRVRAAERENVFFSLHDGVLHIEYPSGTDCRAQEVQTCFWRGVNYFMKKEAKRVLPGRVRQLAAQHGFSFASVKIQPSRSRWGSCSQGKHINLSFYLMLLPPHLVDYVILHELCHTREMNHSPRFWQWMDSVTDGRAKALRAEMKGYQMPRPNTSPKKHLGGASGSIDGNDIVRK